MFSEKIISWYSHRHYATRVPSAFKYITDSPIVQLKKSTASFYILVIIYMLSYDWLFIYRFLYFYVWIYASIFLCVLNFDSFIVLCFQIFYAFIVLCFQNFYTFIVLCFQIFYAFTVLCFQNFYAFTVLCFQNFYAFRNTSQIACRPKTCFVSCSLQTAYSRRLSQNSHFVLTQGFALRPLGHMLPSSLLVCSSLRKPRKSS